MVPGAWVRVCGGEYVKIRFVEKSDIETLSLYD